MQTKMFSTSTEKEDQLASGYESYHGILGRIRDAKLSGSLDSEERSTESECSSCRKRQPKRRDRWCPATFEDNSGTGSLYGDESSGSSIGGSDHSSPYEEIPPELGGCCHCSRPNADRPSSDENYANLPSSSYLAENLIYRDTSFGQEPRVSRRNSSSSQYSNGHIVVQKNLDRGKDSVMPDGSCTNVGRPEEYVESVTDAEKHQIETFFRGLRTDLFVSSSLANLYVGWKDKLGKWSFKHTGVPVILLDRGDTKARNKKRIQIMLAERGTCFPLWKDTIDNLTSYRKAGEAFHTMHLSSDHRQIIGLSFDSSEDSDRFYNYVSELTSNPENINISVPGSKKNKKPSNKKPTALPNKDHISNPCLFEHVTSVAARDKSMYMSLQTLLDKKLSGDRETDYRRNSSAR